MSVYENVISAVISFLNFKRALIALLTCLLSILFISKLLPIVSAIVEPTLKLATEDSKLVLVGFVCILAFFISVVGVALCEGLLTQLKKASGIIKTELCKRKAAKLIAADNEREKACIIEKFAAAQPHISRDSTEIIRVLLTENTQKFPKNDSTIQFLENSDWIQSVAAASDLFNVYKLNDDIREVADNFWNEEVTRNAHDFFSYDSAVWDIMVYEFSNGSKSSERTRLSAFDYDVNEARFHNCFNIQVINSEFFIFRFKGRYQQHFEKLAGKKLNESALISVDK